VAELGGQVHLADEPLAQQAVAQLGVDDFDRHPAMRVLLDGQIHPRHAAGADLTFDVVVGGEAPPQQVQHVGHARKLAVPRGPGEPRAPTTARILSLL